MTHVYLYRYSTSDSVIKRRHSQTEGHFCHKDGTSVARASPIMLLGPPSMLCNQWHYWHILTLTRLWTQCAVWQVTSEGQFVVQRLQLMCKQAFTFRFKLGVVTHNVKAIQTACNGSPAYITATLSIDVLTTPLHMAPYRRMKGGMGMNYMAINCRTLSTLE